MAANVCIHICASQRPSLNQAANSQEKLKRMRYCSHVFSTNSLFPSGAFPCPMATSALQSLQSLIGWREPSSCLQQVTHAFADCLAGPWTSVPWWSLLIVYLLGILTSGICKRRLHRVAVAKLKAFDQRGSGKPMIEAKKKVEMAASALDFGDGPGAKKFLYEALSLIDS